MPLLPWNGRVQDYFDPFGVELSHRGPEFMTPLSECLGGLSFEGVNIHKDIRIAARGTGIEPESDALQPLGFPFRFHPRSYLLGQIPGSKRLVAM
jgi:hypothetical protein